MAAGITMADTITMIVEIMDMGADRTASAVINTGLVCSARQPLVARQKAKAGRVLIPYLLGSACLPIFLYSEGSLRWYDVTPEKWTG